MKKIITILLSFSLVGQLMSQQLAFRGADGYGKFSKGGRGYAVYHVVNLADSGSGSFRDAVSLPKRTVVFDVCGVIHIKSRLSVASEITVAGQTAPGDGITVYGDGVSFSGSNNVIVRYIRFRGGINMSKGTCTLAADDAHDIIFDHVSIEWGRWDNLHIKNSKDITLQYCIIGEAIDPQRFGALLERPVNLTVHHCLWINNQSRNPKAKAGIEFVNNIIYNWGGSGFVGGHSSADNYQDLVNNYFIAGPSSSGNILSMFTSTDHVFQKDNFVDLDKNGVLNGHMITEEEFKKTGATLEPKPHNVAIDPKNIEKPDNIFKSVSAEAGASLHRDAIDVRLIGNLKSLGKTGKIIKSESEVGGQGKMIPIKGLKDTDRDGIPDGWEKLHKLNPNDPADANTKTESGYTNLEEYINELVIKNKK